MNITSKRMKNLRIKLKLTAKEVAEAVNKSQPTILRYESGKIDKIPTDIIDKLAIILRTTPEYLIGSTDDSRIKSKSNQPTLHIVQSELSIPVYGRIFAGAPQGLEEDIEGEFSVPPEIIEEYGIENLLALKVSGDSMNKVVPEGTTIVVNTKYEPIINGHIYAVITDDNEGTLKRVFQYPHRIRFEPDSYNKEHKPWEWTDDLDITVHFIGELVYFAAQINGKGIK
jgi:repressor LexA